MANTTELSSSSTHSRVAEVPRLARPDHKGGIVAGLALCLILAVAQIGLGGYQLGIGNQSIQIAFLKHYAHPELYATDPMVTRTLPYYPTYFFRLLAPLLSLTSLESLYLALHLLTGTLTLAAVYLLGWGIHKSHGGALLGVLLLTAGHHAALGGDTLYSKGFTHTYAALAPAVGALALAYRGRWTAAFALTGALFNIHALTAAYTLAMLGAGLLGELRRNRLGDWIGGAVLNGAVFLLLASPTLALMAIGGQTYDVGWLNLMRIRSADHSFPSTWWTIADAGVPRFVLLFALFVLSLSALPREGPRGGRSSARRLTLLMTGAVGVLFVVGYVFTEIWPLPLVIRLQPFRASRLLLILMLVHIAWGASAMLREAMKPGIPGLLRVFQGLSAVLVLAVLAVPSWLGLLPLTVALAALMALVGGHLSWRQAMVASGALCVALTAALQIRFPLLPAAASLWRLVPGTGDGTTGLHSLGWTSLACVLVLAMPLAVIRVRTHRAVLSVCTLAIGCFLAGMLLARGRNIPSADAARLAGVGAWARQETPASALFLAPTGMANFRIAAERSLVGDWRDGTQLYFAAAFGPDWLRVMSDLEPGFALSDDGTRLRSRGRSLNALSDEDLLNLARDYQADYILLPTPHVDRPRSLAVAYADEQLTVYEPHIALELRAIDASASAQVPPGVFAPERWLQGEVFMSTTVQPNIEKHRKADLTLVISDTAGRPVRDVDVKIDQTKHAFVFGASLGFFEPNDIPAYRDLKPPPVRPIELEMAPQIFNGSMIPFTSKWQYIEPERGQYRWSDMDKYVDYAVKNGWTLEFHHLSGTLPRWVEQMGGVHGQRGLNFRAPIPALQTEFTRYCLDTVERYGDRIKYFQVANEKFMMQYVPPVFRTLKEKFPDNKFGVSDCVKLWDGQGAPGGRTVNTDMLKGADAVDWLIGQGIHPDFFSVHGHQPLGLWADPRQMYEVFDYFAKRNVRVHVTEEYLQIGGPIVGPLRSGVWTPELQADFLARFLTVAYSHPAVDLVNFWGLSPNGWGANNSGMIDARGQPLPVWNALKKLVTETWQTHLAARPFLDGSIKTRAFHGTYRVSMELAGGRTATATFELPQVPSATIRLRLDREAGTLTLVP